MKTRNKKYNNKKVSFNKINKNNKLIIRNSKNNEYLELVHEEKSKLTNYKTDIENLLNLSKVIQVIIIFRYRHILQELPSEQFILNIIINLPIKKCDPTNYTFIELIYGIWRSEINKNKNK